MYAPLVAGKFGELVKLATSAFPPLVADIRRYVVHVYDYVLATEPLSAERLASVGWKRRQGLSDSGNQFHYYRLTADDRILPQGTAYQSDLGCTGPAWSVIGPKASSATIRPVSDSCAITATPMP